MRLPNSKDMSVEQKEVYLKAPLDQSILVSGPPGTGKTVIAFMRAETLARKKQKVNVAMYNTVLCSYSRNASAIEDVQVKTMHSWLWSWWGNMKVPADRLTAERFDLTVSFQEKDKAKALGARWDKWKKCWHIDGEKLRMNPEKYAHWHPSPHPMALPTGDNAWAIDWEAMSLSIFNAWKNGAIDKDAIYWGHLIVDEAQDFPNGMFNLFAFLGSHVFSGSNVKAPALTIFADENQRLNPENNSTIPQIRKALSLPNERAYLLTKNYRNTRPIAALAEYFYVGLSSGKPVLPDIRGEKPVLLHGKRIHDSIEFIARYAIQHDNEQVGVIVQSNKMRKSIYNKLAYALENSAIKIQTYGNKDKEHDDALALDLDAPGIVTVVNKQSCKGLEFDAVFLAELQEVSMSPDAIDQFKMDMYVMCSRARRYLALLYTNEGGDAPQFFKYIPDERLGLLERI